MSVQKRRILVLQPSLMPPGGGNGVAVHAIEALKSEYAVTVATWNPIDLTKINEYFGTTLAPGDFRHVRAPLSWRLALAAVPLRLALLERSLQMRWAREHGGEFAAVLSFNNEIEIGRHCIQYIHFPWGLLPRPETDLRWFHRIPGVLRLYYAAALRLSGADEKRVPQNLTLVNSEWTGCRFRERYGGATVTLHPPCGSASAQEWDARSDTFVIAGRISPEKRIEMAVEVVARLRKHGHDVRLAVIGTNDHPEYYGRISRLAAENRSFVGLFEDIPRPHLLSTLESSRYGIHAMEDEHFGMAIAEMMLAGCIPFVHRSGGASEVVGDDRLVWSTVDEAAGAIERVLTDERLRDELRLSAAQRAGTYTTKAFREALRRHVRAFVCEAEKRRAGQPSVAE